MTSGPSVAAGVSVGWGGGGGGGRLQCQPRLEPPHPLSRGNGPSEALCPLAAGFAPIHPVSGTEPGSGGPIQHPLSCPHPPQFPTASKSCITIKTPHSPWLLFLANLCLLCLSSPPSLPPLHLPPSLSLGGKKVIAQMISQSSVAVATGCWNWDRRAARTTERSSISQGWGSPAFVFAFKSRGARRCEAPSSTPRVGPFHQQLPTVRLRVIKLPASQCQPWSRYGLGVSSASLGVVVTSFAGGALCTGKEAPALGGAAVEPDTSWFRPRGRAGGDRMPLGFRAPCPLATSHT